MGEVSTIGLDIAKSVFQIHGVDAAGVVVIRKRISQAKLLEFFGTLSAYLVGIEGGRDYCAPICLWCHDVEPKILV
jgi:transposase